MLVDTALSVDYDLSFNHSYHGQEGGVKFDKTEFLHFLQHQVKKKEYDTNPPSDCGIPAFNRHEVAQQSLGAEEAEAHIGGSGELLKNGRVEETIG